MADEAAEDAPPTSPRNNSSQASTDAPPTAGRQAGMAGLLSDKRTDLLMNVTRLFVLIFTLGYLTGLGGNAAFHKALMAMAASSALRLYQRTREPGSRGGGGSYAQTFAALLNEDSCHHLLYCILFLIGSPVTFVLLPICVFAFLHSMSFFVKLSNEMNMGTALFRPIGRLLEAEQQRLLMTAAVGEIMMMLVSVFMVVTGKIMLVAPFMYYRFLQLRYRSRRNPYCRLVFTQLRIGAERIALQAPPVVGNVITKAVAFISRLAPAVQA
ncbi:putative Transmembrane protein 33 [Hypsibius exemplaris]|uniref:Transmembrane protein 33 n=1 Tax=Hypsibius exemplaris TaxID=2072580 RepID=A0A1W0WN85_HYPEX|nr:putative Transmembrane protein 33 [Hypsibius exemplaris]